MYQIVNLLIMILHIQIQIIYIQINHHVLQWKDIVILFDNKTTHTHTASYDTLKYTQLYNQSRIVQPNIEKISYIYCKT